MNYIDLIEIFGNRNMCFPNVRFTMRIAFAQPITAAIGKGGFWFEGDPGERVNRPGLRHICNLVVR